MCCRERDGIFLNQAKPPGAQHFIDGDIRSDDRTRGLERADRPFVQDVKRFLDLLQADGQRAAGLHAPARSATERSVGFDVKRHDPVASAIDGEQQGAFFVDDDRPIVVLRPQPFVVVKEASAAGRIRVDEIQPAGRIPAIRENRIFAFVRGLSAAAANRTPSASSIPQIGHVAYSCIA